MKRRASGDERAFRRAIEALRGVCPTNLPVQVRRCAVPQDLLGDADLVPKGRRSFYLVRVSNAIDIQHQIAILIHEWAHCLTWAISHERHPDHGPHFGIAYSECYNAVHPKD